MSGFVARFGIDTKAFSQGLDRSVRTARRAADRMGRTFENRMERVQRTARRVSRFVQRNWSRAFQLAGVGAAAGIAAMLLSLNVAAERSLRVQHTLDGIKSSWSNMVEDIGREVSLGDAIGLGEAIDGLNEFRKDFSDGFFNGLTFGIFSDNIKASRAFLEREKAMDRQLESLRAFEDQRDTLLAQGGGTAGREAADRLARRRFTQGLDPNLTRTQRLELLALHDQGVSSRNAASDAEAAAKAASTRDRNASAFGGSIRRFQSMIAEAGATDLTGRVRAARLGAMHEEIEAIEQIRALEGITETQRTDLINLARTAIETRTEARIKEFEEADKRERRQATTRRRESDQERKIADLRARGSTRIADAMQEELETRREIREILEDENLSAQQKAESIRGIGSSASGRLGRLLTPGRVLEAGFAGDAATRAQILGPGPGGASGESPTVAGIKELNETVKTTVREALEELAGGRPIVS